MKNKSVEGFLKDKLRNGKQEHNCENCGLRYDELKQCGGYYGCYKIRLSRKLEKDYLSDEEKADAAERKYLERKKTLERAIEEMEMAHKYEGSEIGKKLAISAKSKLDSIFNREEITNESEKVEHPTQTEDKKNDNEFAGNAVQSKSEKLKAGQEKNALRDFDSQKIASSFRKENALPKAAALAEQIDENLACDMPKEQIALLEGDKNMPQIALLDDDTNLPQSALLDDDTNLPQSALLDDDTQMPQIALLEGDTNLPQIALLDDDTQMPQMLLGEEKNTSLSCEECYGGEPNKDLEEAADAVSKLGKFKSADELLRAYNALESEFTKRCQKLKALENQALKNAQANSSFAAEELPKPHNKMGAEAQIQNLSIDAIDGRIMCLLEDEEFVDSVVLHNPKIRAKIIAEYLRTLKEKQSVQVLPSGYGRTALQSLPKPKTLEEAKKLTGMLFF